MGIAKNKLREILERFEKERKPLSEAVIEDTFRGVRKEIGDEEFWKSMEMGAERIAFALSSGYGDDESRQGPYFHPRNSTSYENGVTVDFPDIKSISPEMIDYWEKRAGEAKHPILKARYAGLVWELSKPRANKNPDPNMARIVIESILEAKKEKLFMHEMNMIHKLEWAIVLSMKLNDRKYQKQVIEAIISFEDFAAKDDLLGTWGFSYYLLMKNKKIPISETQAKKIIDDLEIRLDRIINSVNPDPFGAEAAALRLAEYYKKEKSPQKVKHVLTKYGNCFKEASKKVIAPVASAWMGEVNSIYTQYGLKNEADSISVVQQEISRDVLNELKPIYHNFTIPKEDLEKLSEEALKGGINTAILRIIYGFIPDKNEEQNQIKSLSKKFISQNLFNTVLLDHNGIPVSQVGTIDRDPDGQIVLHISNNLKFASFFLNYVLRDFIAKYDLSEEKIIGILFESPVFLNDRNEIIRKGVKFYLEGDFLSCAHLLIPQIEAAFRELVKLNGGVIFKNNRLGGKSLTTFDEVLRNPTIKQTFNEDIVLYLRILFTDQRGWNIRNKLCHGLFPSQFIGEDIADKIFHTLLLLSQVRIKKE